MSTATQLLFDTTGALDHPVTRTALAISAAALAATPLVMLALQAMGKVSEKTRRDVWTRYFTWLWLTPAIVLPIVWCPLSAVLMFTLASILCYRELSRATGLFRERAISAVVVIGILALGFAAADRWYGFFVAITPLTMTFIAVVGVLPDRPKGYLQRVSLAAVSFLLFGSGLMHLAYMTVDVNYRPILCALVLCAQGSDIAAYCCGKAFGHRKLFANTSPNKTLGGHLGALLITAPLAAYLMHLTLPNTPIDRWWWLAAFGLVIAICAQFGDLVLGSIKRDLGVKDLAVTLPGHGGFSDRFNSLLLVAPAAFHIIGYLVGFGLDRPVRILSSLFSGE